jgi:uncharacterized membrane protein YozB (DUF420 family)
MDVRDLPTVNAALNGTAAVLIFLGWRAILGGHVVRHRILMFAALGCSVLFLASYLTYHAQVGSVRFAKTGLIRTVYLGILLTHTILAVVIVPLIGTTVFRAIRGQLEAHRRIARVTLPLWGYVSVTGVVIYWMLYRL